MLELLYVLTDIAGLHYLTPLDRWAPIRKRPYRVEHIRNFTKAREAQALVRRARQQGGGMKVAKAWLRC